MIGDRQLRSITLTSLLEWVTDCLAVDMPHGSIKLYFELVDTIMAAAVIDRLLPDNPADGARPSKILRGVARAPKWVPDEDDVTRLFRQVPERYRAALWLGAGQGLRLGEAMGMEDGTRCLDRAAGELHVIQQMQYSPKVDGGHYLTTPKAGSAGTVELDPLVAYHLGEHVARFLRVEVELVDETAGLPVRRVVPFLFTTTHGNPINDRTWSREWVKWRDAAGWPCAYGGFHALRHFFATTLITNHAEPQEVQHALRHKTLRYTLETYVGWWLKRDRKRGLVGTVLQAAAARFDLQEPP